MEQFHGTIIQSATARNGPDCILDPWTHCDVVAKTGMGLKDISVTGSLKAQCCTMH